MSPYLKRSSRKSSLPAPSAPAARKSKRPAYGEDETRTILRSDLGDDDSTNDRRGMLSLRGRGALKAPRTPSFASPAVLSAPPPPPPPVKRVYAQPEPYFAAPQAHAVAPQQSFSPAQYAFPPAPPSSFAPVAAPTTSDSQAELPVPPFTHTQRDIRTQQEGSSKLGRFVLLGGGAVLGLFMGILALQANANSRQSHTSAAAEAPMAEVRTTALPAPPPAVVSPPIAPAAVQAQVSAPTVITPAAVTQPPAAVQLPAQPAPKTVASNPAPVKAEKPLEKVAARPAPVVRQAPVAIAPTPRRVAPEVVPPAPKASRSDDAHKALAEANANIEGSL